MAKKRANGEGNIRKRSDGLLGAACRFQRHTAANTPQGTIPSPASVSSRDIL